LLIVAAQPLHFKFAIIIFSFVIFRFLKK
jgi:hypothetical protein